MPNVPDGSRRTVLIADDSSFMRSILRGILEMGGYHVVAEAADGVEAVEQYERHRPAVTFIDSIMPRQDGSGAVAAILARDGNARIILCGSDDGAFSQLVVASGALGGLVKPYVVEQVLTVAEAASEGGRGT